MTEARIALPLRRTSGVLARVMQAVAVVANRRRDRNRLGQLDAHLLRDIGMGAQEAEAECRKPFWKP